ncbi:MAG: 3-dehydroquinate synthase [Pseudomonadota bacterium]|nr:3-dehydroquinate synthase [Pseudomonadota bacterium]
MSPSSDEVVVELGSRSYAILIGSGGLDRPESYAGLPSGGDCAIVCNATVAPLYAGRLHKALAGRYRSIHEIVLPDGEAHKDWPTLQKIFDTLLAAKCDRETTIFALGGGVTGDTAGFAAACYMRGVPYVQVPTTLLAQVDSAVGGKTAINHPLGKNMIGAFHQPARVVVDVETLHSLPRRELASGLAEVIKYGVISDDAFLDWIDSHLADLLSCDTPAMVHAVRRSCEIKAAIVGADEREAGLRAVLNFGHTFAHAIETGLGYGVWLHGEAVGCGMVMAADLSVRLGLVDRSYADRIRRIVDRAGLPVKAPPLPVPRYLELMRQDKKANAGEMRFVLVEAPGRAVVRPVAARWVSETIESTRQTA